MAITFVDRIFVCDKVRLNYHQVFLVRIGQHCTVASCKEGFIWFVILECTPWTVSIANHCRIKGALKGAHTDSTKRDRSRNMREEDPTNWCRVAQH